MESPRYVSLAKIPKPNNSVKTTGSGLKDISNQHQEDASRKKKNRSSLGKSLPWALASSPTRFSKNNRMYLCRSTALSESAAFTEISSVTLQKVLTKSSAKGREPSKNSNHGREPRTLIDFLASFPRPAGRSPPAAPQHLSNQGDPEVTRLAPLSTPRSRLRDTAPPASDRARNAATPRGPSTATTAPKRKAPCPPLRPSLSRGSPA